jgi:hypothetical protein
MTALTNIVLAEPITSASQLDGKALPLLALALLALEPSRIGQIYAPDPMITQVPDRPVDRGVDLSDAQFRINRKLGHRKLGIQLTFQVLDNWLD